MIMAGLEGIKTRTGRIEEIRGRGLMIAIDVEDDSEVSCTTHIHQELVRRGYVLARRPGVSVLRLDPALTIERTDIEGFLKALDDVLTDRSS